mgnify:FL=1
MNLESGLMMKNKKGFTLIELLAVIVILGILLSISITAVNKIKKKQNVSNKVNVISDIFSEAKKYVSENPNVITIDGSNDHFEISMKDLIEKKYLEIDEDKYPDLIYGNNGSDKNTYRHLTVYQCMENDAATGKLEYRYYLKNQDGDWKYRFTDCGCSPQSLNSKSYTLCEETSGDNSYTNSGWDNDGKYYNNGNPDSSKDLNEDF